MRRPGGLESPIIRRALAGVASAAVHVAMLLAVLLSGSRHEGDGASETPLTELLLIEAPDADYREGLDLVPLEAAAASAANFEQLLAAAEPPAPGPAEAVAAEFVDEQPEHIPEPPPATEAAAVDAVDPAPTAIFITPPAQRAQMSERLARLAEEFASRPQAEVVWEEDGLRYSAVLVQERANDGTALERVVAEVSAAGRGERLLTRVILKRLAFSQFTQMVDRWDPMVQLHDDVIVGRFHSNSRFNVLYDSGAAPRFLGKVSTAARSFGVKSGGRRNRSDIFRDGVQTRAGRIPLPQELQPFRWAPIEANARVHELTDDANIRFFTNGDYMWSLRRKAASEYVNAPAKHPIYFIAKPGATLYVKGVVAGKILVYSPERIVIEGSLTYAHDPREVADSPDYLGLVCDRNIEVARPSVTGPGDLRIDGAILAGRRFAVREINHPRSATLRIFGSLSAGSLSATEPRYATKIEYDERLERRRPPGFPSTNRFEAEDWDGRWFEAPERL